MKLRNQLLAFFCLLVFAAFGFLYVRTWVVQKPFGIILFISDGMVARQIAAARLYEGGANYRLGIDAFPHLAMIRNSARDFAVPDSASAATALATGVRVGHRALSIGENGQTLTTILDLARAHGRGLGLVTSGRLTAPTPAAFYANLVDAREVEPITKQFMERANLDVVLAGGSDDFLPLSKGGARTDGRDLLAELQGRGWEIVRSKAELENAAPYRAHTIAGFFSGDHLVFSNQIESGSQQPSLADMVRRAIQFLETQSKGYVLIVDAAHVSIAAQRNEGERAIAETAALDHAIATATKYAGEKSLILAVGKHSIGGMSLNGYPLVLDHGVALLGVNASGQPAITWASGPNGPASTNFAAFEDSVPASAPNPTTAPQTPGGNRAEPAAFQAPSALNTAEDVIAIGRGDGAEKLHGFLDNTAIFEILKAAL